MFLLGLWLEMVFVHIELQSKKTKNATEGNSFEIKVTIVFHSNFVLIKEL